MVAEATQSQRKPPLLFTDPDHHLITPFGVQPGDVLRTPLGLVATVLGARCSVLSDATTARLIVQYSENGWVAPLEPQATALQGGVTLKSLGYAQLTGPELLRWQVEQRSKAATARHAVHEAAGPKAPATQQAARTRTQRGGAAP